MSLRRLLLAVKCVVNYEREQLGLAFAGEAQSTAYTFRLLDEQAVFTPLYFSSYVPRCSRPPRSHAQCDRNRADVLHQPAVPSRTAFIFDVAVHH
jgi:hypothetical protein